MNYDFLKRYILLSFQRTMVDRNCTINLNLREIAFQGLVTQVNIVPFRTNRVFAFVRAAVCMLTTVQFYAFRLNFANASN